MGIRGATRFERAGPTGTGVAVIDQGVPLGLPVVAGLETLSAGAKISIAARVVAKLFLAEQPIADRRPALWVGDIGVDTRLLAGPDILTFVIALVGNGIDPLDAEHFFGGAGGLRQQPEIAAGVGHLLRDDQLVFGVDRDLSVVAHPHLSGTEPSPDCLDRSAKFGSRRCVPIPGDSSAYRPRRCFRTGIFSAKFFAGALLAAPSSPSASIETRQIVDKPLIRPLDQPFLLLAGEVAIAAVDRLQPGAVDRYQLTAKEIEFAA